MNLKLPFAFKNNQMVTVDEVERGIKCNCQCPACGSPLVARHGTKMVHHFAHYNTSECEYAIETTLHFLAKEILAKEKKIMLPPVHAKIGANTVKIYREQILNFDTITLEKILGSIKPDITIEKNGKKLLVEIAVTHFIDDVKLRKIKNLNYSTIEIDLSNYKNISHKSELRKILFEENEQKKWIYNSKQAIFKKSIKKYAVKFETIHRGFATHVDYCPIKARIWKGKPYANMVDDCFYCDYFVGREEPYVYCTGKYKKDIDKLIEKYRGCQRNPKKV